MTRTTELAALALATLAACGGDDGATLAWHPTWHEATTFPFDPTDALAASASGDVFVLGSPSTVRRWSGTSAAWSTPHLFATLGSDLLAVDDAGTALAFGVDTNGNLVAARFAAGGAWPSGWTQHQIAARNLSGSVEPQGVAMTAAGVGVVAWRESDGAGTERGHLAFHDPATGWSAPVERPGAPFLPIELAAADVGDEVVAVVSWASSRNQTTAEIMGAVVRYRPSDGQATWEPAAELASIPQVNAVGPLIGIDRSGAASVLVTEASRLTLVRHTTAWQEPIVVATAAPGATLGVSSLAVDPDGPVLAAWYACGSGCALSVRRWAPAGLGDAQTLSTGDSQVAPLALAASGGHALGLRPVGTELWAYALADGVWGAGERLGTAPRPVIHYFVDLRWGQVGAAAWSSRSSGEGVESTVLVYDE